MTAQSRVSELAVVVEVTDEVMPGVVSLAHGWARVNSNVLTDGDVFDAISGIATLNGIPAHLRHRWRATRSLPDITVRRRVADEHRSRAGSCRTRDPGEPGGPWFAARGTINMRIRHVAVVSAAAIAVGIVGVNVAAAHGGDTTRIHACVTDAGGRVRLIAADGACQSSERAVDWNIQGAPGPEGDQGVQGEPGPQGEPGGMSGYEIVESTPTELQPGTGQLQRVSCPAGKVVVGGGGYSADGGSRMDSSFPDVKDGIYRWNAFMRNDLTAASITVSVKAVCVDA